MSRRPKSTTETTLKYDLTDDQLDELYSWIDNIPISRPKRNFARDFSDGVLTAEVLAFFMPKEIDTIYYQATHSSAQKKANWKMLNLKALSKLGIKISESTIDKLVDAKAGFIEQVMWEIRSKLPNSDPSKVKPRRNTGKPFETPSRKSLSLKAAASTPMAKHVDKVIEISNADENNNNNFIGDSEADKPNYNRAECVIHTPHSLIPFKINTEVCPSSALVENAITVAAQPKQKPLHRGKSVPSTNIVGPRKSSLVVHNNSGVEQRIVNYGGMKMIPALLLDEKEEERKALEKENKDLESKIHRLERLLGVKDQRVEDLTNQLHRLHDLYERVDRPVDSVFSEEILEQSY